MTCKPVTKQLQLLKEKFSQTTSAFTCNQDEISSWDQKILFPRTFHPRMKQGEFHPGMKFNLKENIPLSMKTYNKIYHFT